MADPFQPLDLKHSCNTGGANVRSGDGWLWPYNGDDPDNTQLRGMPSGENLFWGVPFKAASDDADLRYIAVCGAEAEIEEIPESVTIAVGQQARRLLFAHACAPSADGSEGVGEQVGVYRIHFDDGSMVEQELRDPQLLHQLGQSSLRLPHMPGVSFCADR